jgi:hypothetical protein
VGEDEPKSAVELAMERLRKKDEKEGVSERRVSEEQRSAIAELHRTYEAKLAEIEILHKSKLAGTMEYEARQALEDDYRRDRERLTGERDRKIEAIRSADPASS